LTTKTTTFDNKNDNVRQQKVISKLLTNVVVLFNKKYFLMEKLQKSKLKSNNIKQIKKI
jgi:hypothetical protein